MRVKKKELRKRLPQLPINYPAPVVADFDFDSAKARVEDLAKRLADNEAEARDAVLAQLPAYIREVTAALLPEAPEALPADAPDDAVVQQMDAPAAAELSLLFDKLCLGLFFCLWHSDKPLVQLECAHAMSLLLHAAPLPFARDLFLRSLFRTLEANWLKIDKWRLDKYMAWVRKIVFQAFVHLKNTTAPAKPPAAAVGAAAKAARGSATKSGAGEAPVTAGKKGRSAATVPRAAVLAVGGGKAAAAGGDDGADDDGDGTPITAAAVEAAAALPSVRRFTACFRRDVLRGGAAGLAMHCADVWATELLREADVPPPLFVALCRGGPLATLQRGDDMERRVMNNFVVPVAAGALEARGLGFSVAVARSLADIAAELSVGPGTHFAARPLMTETQLLLERYAEGTERPEVFEALTGRDERRSVMGEVKAAEEAKVRMAQAGIKRRGKVVASEAARRARRDPGRQSKRGQRWKRG